jgi:glucokinase
MSAEPVYAIGVDVGGTKLAAGLVRFPDGAVLARRMLPTHAPRGGYAVLADTLDMVAGLQAEAAARGVRPAGVGVDVCELVDPRGCVTSSHTVAWAGLPVRDAFAELLPAVVEADVRAHALAEAHLGAGRGCASFVFVTVGTGISSCFVQGGVPLLGAHGNALVLASSPHTTTCTECGATLRPVLEEIAAGPGLVAIYNRARMRRAPHVPPAARGEEVLAAAALGDQDAAAAIHTAAGALGVSIGWLVNVLDPHAVVVGGGLGSAPGLYWEAMVAATRDHILSEVSRSVRIVPAELGPDAGLIGAALAAVQKFQLAR